MLKQVCAIGIVALAVFIAASAHQEECASKISTGIQDKLCLLQVGSEILRGQDLQAPRKTEALELGDLTPRNGGQLVSKGILGYIFGSSASNPDQSEEAEPVASRRGSWAWAYGGYGGRNKWNRWRHDHFTRSHAGPGKFFGSVSMREWLILLLALPLCLALYLKLMDWPSTRWYHSLALIFWFCGAAVYAAMVWVFIGAKQAETWTSGYALELVFSIENIFIFHIVVEQFRVPRKLAQKAIFVVIWFQILFQMACFLGLAWWILSIKVLPYIMGCWLIYVGVQTIREEQHNVQYTSLFNVVWACQAIFGRLFVTGYRRDCSIFFLRERNLHITLLFPVILCLLVVDLIMEVDVTITKIEEIDNHYIAFTSSVLAAFAVPELFFVVRDLFHRFYLLKYGITFTLFFFGGELLCHQVVDIPAVVGVVVIAIAMALCVGLSYLLGYSRREDPKYLGSDVDITDCTEDIIDATDWLRPVEPAAAGRKDVQEQQSKTQDDDKQPEDNNLDSKFGLPASSKAASSTSQNDSASSPSSRSWWQSGRSFLSNVGPKKNRHSDQ